jgi:hypothetical protein
MQVKLAGLDQEHDRDSGELLTHRAELEPGLRGALGTGFDVGQAARQVRLNRSGPSDHRRAAKVSFPLHRPILGPAH